MSTADDQQLSKERFGRYQITASQRRGWRVVISVCAIGWLIFFLVGIIGAATGHSSVGVTALPLSFVLLIYGGWCAWTISSSPPGSDSRRGS